MGFPYYLDFNLPDMASMTTNLPNDDLCGFSVDGFGKRYESDPAQEFALSSTAIGSGINLNLFKFSGAYPYEATGSQDSYIANPYSPFFNLAISPTNLIVIVDTHVPPNPYSLSSVGPSYIDFLWQALNAAPWNGMTYNPLGTVAGGNSPTLTRTIAAWQVAGPYLQFHVRFTLTDIAAIAPVPIGPDNNQPSRGLINPNPQPHKLGCTSTCIPFAYKYHFGQKV